MAKSEWVMRWFKMFHNFDNPKFWTSKISNDELGAWVRLLAMASRNTWHRGKIGITESVAYEPIQVNSVIKTDKPYLKKWEEQGAISVKNGIIQIENWEHYQNEQDRKNKNKLKQTLKQTPQTDTLNSETDLDLDLDLDLDKDKDNKKTKPLAPVGAGYNFFKIFFDKYLEHRKEKYTSFNEKKEAGLLKNICKKITQVEYELALDRFHALSDNFVKGNGYNVVAFTTKLQGLLSNNYSTPAKDIPPERDYK